MIMSAGIGSRLRPYTDFLPKALLPVLSIPCAQYTVDFCSAAGVNNFVFNSHHHHQALSEGIGKLDFGSGSFKISDESKKLLGSLGGVRTALPFLGDGPFIRVNADRVLDLPVDGLLDKHEFLHKNFGVEVTLLLMKSKDPATPYPEIKFDAQSGLVSDIDLPKTKSLYFAGVSIMESSGVKHFPVNEDLDYVRDYLRPLIKSKKVGGFVLERDPVLWVDMDTPSLWIDAHYSVMSWIKNPVASKWMRERVLSENIWIRDDLMSSKKFVHSPNSAMKSFQKGYQGYSEALSRGLTVSKHNSEIKAGVLYNNVLIT